jgi:hypothetical protein
VEGESNACGPFEESEASTWWPEEFRGESFRIGVALDQRLQRRRLGPRHGDTRVGCTTGRDMGQARMAMAQRRIGYRGEL